MRGSLVSTGFVGLSLLSFLTTPARASDMPRVEPLWEAKRLGHVTVKGQSLGSHDAARLTISNKSGEAISVDVNGAYLRPVASDVQPLGIGLMKPGSDLTTLDLKPDGSSECRVLTVCMNKNVPSPDCSTRFALADCAAPGETGKILRFWKTQPSVDLGSIQAAVWAGNLEACHAQADLPTFTRKVGAVQGEVFVLRETGELLRGKLGTGLHQVANGIVDFWTGKTGLHVLRRSREGDGQRFSDRGFCVEGYDLAHGGRFTAETAVFECQRVLWASAEGALVADANHLYLYAGDYDWRVVGGPASPVSPLEDGALVLGEAKDGKTPLTRISRKKDELEVSEVSVDAVLTGIAQGEDGTYATCKGGELIRLDAHGKKLETSPTRECRAVSPASSFVAVETPSGWSLGKDGKASWVSLPPERGALVVDRWSGELYVAAAPSLYKWDGEHRVWKHFPIGESEEVRRAITEASGETASTGDAARHAAAQGR